LIYFLPNISKNYLYSRTKSQAYHSLRSGWPRKRNWEVRSRVFYSAFSEAPLAAASLGQVHLATLPTGHSVAVKVQRPNIDAIVEADLGSLRYIVSWLERFTAIRRRVDLSAVLVEFEDTLRLELDYIAEGHHAERISVMFRDDPRIVVPRVYWSHSTLASPDATVHVGHESNGLCLTRAAGYQPCAGG